MSTVSPLLRTEIPGLATGDHVLADMPAPARDRLKLRVRDIVAWRNLKKRFLARQLVLLAIHVVILTWSFWMAFQLRFDLAVPEAMVELYWKTLPLVVGIKLIVFSLFGSTRGWWRYVTFADLAKILQVCTISAIAICGIDYLFFPSFQIPRASLVLDWGITILSIGGSRSVCRLAREHFWPALDSTPTRRAILVGVGLGGETLVQQLQSHPRHHYRVVGFLHDNRAYHGTRLAGVPFLGGVDKVVSIAAGQRVKEILVIVDSLSGSRLRELLSDCRNANLSVKMIPNVSQMLDSHRKLSVREADVNDLLRRDPVELDTPAISGLLGGQCVLVTGAGGSIGAEVCRQVAKYHPSQLVLVERAENNLFHIEQELIRTYREVACRACIADVCDKPRLEAVFARYRPRIVFHAAAHKHVPLMEFNAGEAIKNNIFGTRTVADVAAAFDTERFVLISTDKAVNPTSIMGASKLIAERYVKALSDNAGTRFVVVRFGNVLGSAGSVVPIFQDQIRRGGPITITHPEMRRFFMTIPEAAQLVLQAAALGEGGETFVLDMGRPVKIVDLALDLICLSGYAPNEIETKFIGPRPGEKLYEEVFYDEEPTAPSRHPKLRVACRPAQRMAEVHKWLDELAPLINASDEMIRQKFQQLALNEGLAKIVARHPGPSAANGNGNGNGNGHSDDHMLCQGNGNGTVRGYVATNGELADKK